MAQVSIDQFLQTEATGTYDPDGATVTARVVDATTGELIVNGDPDGKVTHPNWRFTYEGVPSAVLVRLEVTADDGEDPFTARDEKTF